MRFEWNFRYVIFNLILMIEDWGSLSLVKLPSGNKPLPERMLSQLYVAIWRDRATIIKFMHGFSPHFTFVSEPQFDISDICLFVNHHAVWNKQQATHTCLHFPSTAPSELIACYVNLRYTSPIVMTISRYACFIVSYPYRDSPYRNPRFQFSVFLKISRAACVASSLGAF